MSITRFEALKAVDDIFNYCEEIDNSLPENERSGYKMLPDIHKIRKYIIENTRPHGEWESLKEHITEMRDDDGKLNQKQTCQFIFNLMGVIEREGDEK